MAPALARRSMKSDTSRLVGGAWTAALHGRSVMGQTLRGWGSLCDEYLFGIMGKGTGRRPVWDKLRFW
jgi:hypothetical protein